MLAAVTSLMLSLAPAPAPVDNLAEPVAEEEPVAEKEPPPPEEPPPPVEPPPPSAPTGGFGQVGDVAVDSNVQAPPPPPVEPNAEQGTPDKPRFELTGRAEIGFAQTDVGNADSLDHGGLFLRAHVALFPWVSKRRTIAAGIGAAYSYAGLNRTIDPNLGFGLDKSKAQQQAITLNFEVLVRPHVDWFAVHFSPMIGFGWYANANLLMADRPAEIASDEYGLAAGGSLALCTAWGIACVTGGSQILLAISSTALEGAIEDEPPVINPWGWHVALGVDVARIVMRANRVPR